MQGRLVLWPQLVESLFVAETKIAPRWLLMLSRGLSWLDELRKDVVNLLGLLIVDGLTLHRLIRTLVNYTMRHPGRSI